MGMVCMWMSRNNGIIMVMLNVMKMVVVMVVVVLW